MDSLIPILWLVAMISLRSSHANTSHRLNSEQLLLLQRSYYSAIIQNTGLDLTPAQLDSALRQIISQPSPNIPYNSEYVCQPRPHIVSKREIEEEFLQNQRISHRTSSVVTASQCFLLHRCEKSSGCCQGNSECMAYEEKTIQVPVTVHILGSWSMSTEYVRLTNHTSCRCRGEIQECVCPHPLKSEYSQDRFDCSCRCDPNDVTCHGFLNGTNNLDWSRSNLPWLAQTDAQSLSFHQSCIHHTSIGYGHFIGRHCPEIPCQNGRIFNPETVRCELVMQSSTASTLSSSVRYVRDYLRNQNGEQASPSTQISFGNTATTPLPGSAGLIDRSNAENTSTTRRSRSVTRPQRTIAHPITTTRPPHGDDMEARSITRPTFSEERTGDDEMNIFQYVIHRGLTNVRSDMRMMRKIIGDLQGACTTLMERRCGGYNSEFSDVLIQPSRAVRIRCTIPDSSCIDDRSVLTCPKDFISVRNCFSEQITRVRHKRKARRS